MVSRGKNRRTFLDTYSTSEAYLLRPNPKLGKPGLIEGVGKSGEPVLIREWRKGSSEDERVIDELWKNELRLLYRLAAAPGAADCISKLIDAGRDSNGYYIVIGAGQRRPIALYFSTKSGNLFWQRQVSSAQNRLKLWANLRRIAVGLETLHSQGLIHCNLDQWSILSSGGTEPDFQLTGFEWSMRLNDANKSSSPRRNSDPGRAFSFRDDWASFAKVAASLFNITGDRLSKSSIIASDVSENTSADEISLLRDLIDPPHMLQIDGDYVKGRIDAIVNDLQAVSAADEAQYHLIVGVDQRGPLAQAIREASGLSIEIDDRDSLLEFIRADLSEKPRVITAEGKSGTYYVLRGAQLVYPLSQYTVRNSTRVSWEFAKIDRAEFSENWKGKVAADSSVPTSAIRMLTFSEASQTAGRMAGRVLSWDRLFVDSDSGEVGISKRQRQFLTAITMLHALKLVLTASELYPVEIVEEVSDDPGGGTRISLSLIYDDAKEVLWKNLGLRSNNERLRDLIESDLKDDEGWLLADRKRLGRRTGSDVELEFDSVEVRDNRAVYIFRAKGHSLPGRQEAVLIPGALRGDLEQFQRSAKAIMGLKEQAELLSTLTDPRSTVSLSVDEVQKDMAFGSLDPAKQTSLENIFQVLPIYAVQGPPGVGKTFLVRDALRRTFESERASRVLLTAQSHHAVDHLMNELIKDWDLWSSGPPLAVRSKSRDAKTPDSPIDVPNQRKQLINRFSASALYDSLSPTVRDRVDLLNGKLDDAELRDRRTVDRRTLDGLILRAANIVFATTNARDLERLYDERGQFDWTIIEEAGKATGIELLMPLLLSHQRLMIGDHKQLPPFGSKEIQELLNNPKGLREALIEGLELVERDFKDFIDDELYDVLTDDSQDDEMARLCGDASRVLFYFETLVEGELARQAKPGARGPNQANLLSFQHRMHPTICEMVSHCFYNGELKTWPAAAGKFHTITPPIQGVLGSNAPITVINTPYQQSSKGKQSVERFPRYTNSTEVDAVVSLLESISPSGSELPSLAILSPYGRQVRALRDAVNDRDIDLVSRFSPSVRGSDWFSTVDSFQGNEADVVILSLVRNNHHSNVKSALGFLSQSERMNVALSRAKWRLFIVTSLEFLNTVTFPIGQNTPPVLDHLKRFLDWINTSKEAKIISVVSSDSIGFK